MLELATLNEYILPLEPRIVLWFFYENDLNNLQRELNSPFLVRYLNNKKFTQNLIIKQKKIDDLLLRLKNKQITQNHILNNITKIKLTNLDLLFEKISSNQYFKIIRIMHALSVTIASAAYI